MLGGKTVKVKIDRDLYDRVRKIADVAGYATPEAAFQSTIFAHSQGDYNTFLASLTGDLARDNKEVLERKTPEGFAEYLRQGTAKITSYRILEREEISPEETVLVIYEAGINEMEHVLVRKVGDEWKLAGPAADKTKPQ